MDWIRIQTRLMQLGHNPGPIDGIPGRLTRGAVRRFQAARGLVVDGQVGPQTMGALFTADDPQIGNVDLPWFEEARSQLGLREAPGRANNPEIMDWAEELDLDSVYTGDHIAWCGLFVAQAIASALPEEPLPVNPLGARNYLGFGRSIEGPSIGAIVPFWRVSPSDWRGHVGFVAGWDDTHIACLGGNQGDAVNIRRIPRSRVLDYRWPIMTHLRPDFQRRIVWAPATDGNEA